ncbi:MAG: DUF4255 domain-containing protein [Chitinophagaceae bacterium]|nr:DUF4255 domain-containing protein [Chitinophagaceae bacterium]
MIEQTLSFLAGEINSFTGNKDYHYRNQVVAMVCDLVDHKGEPTFLKRLNETTGDFLLLTLINVEEEVIGKSQLPYFRKPDQTLDVLNPELRVNLYVLVTGASNRAESERYINTLRMLSYAIGCFQYKNVFEKLSSPTLPEEIEKLVVELVSPTFEQQNHIWGGLGAKYQPSVLYKVKLLTYREILESNGAGMVKRIRSGINGN